ncbi:MAG: hypothetical protein V1810_00555 [Candidatus Beckwithbacteria bacterium]
MVEVKPLNLSSETATPTPTVIKPTAPINSQPVGNGKKKLVAWLGFIIILGIGSGYGLSKIQQPKGVKELSRTIENGAEPGSTYGVQDEAAFSDTAEGEMTSGGIDGEGSHHLIRDGGESQYVYLTSSIIDLDQFVGKKVKVWGQTFEAQKAGWLMDVGRLEILE